MLSLHTNFNLGSYLADLTDRLQRFENPDLKEDPENVNQLKPIFDGGSSLALGYGFDLLVHSNAQIVQAIQALEAAFTLTDQDFGWANASEKAHDLNLLDIFRQSRDGLSEQQWRARENKLFLRLPPEPVATALLQAEIADDETLLNRALTKYS